MRASVTLVDMSDYNGPEVDAWRLHMNGYESDLRALLDDMTPRELKVLESEVRAFQRQIALAQVRRGVQGAP